MEEKIKAKIKGIVEAYIKLFPEEYELVKKFIKENRSKLKTEYGELKGDHVIKRSLYEIPESLSSMFISGLSEQELIDFREPQLARWFAKTFKEFSTAEKI